jgi:hypothetical protein
MNRKTETAKEEKPRRSFVVFSCASPMPFNIRMAQKLRIMGGKKQEK